MNATESDMRTLAVYTPLALVAVVLIALNLPRIVFIFDAPAGFWVGAVLLVGLILAATAQAHQYGYL